jgi:hypothetical protein
MASIAAGVPFGFGMVLVFLGIINYLIDAYTIFSASVLAANAVLRSVFGAVIPLFATQMYDNLGIHWASTIPAFLALICVPFPFLFYKYGPRVRVNCKYAQQADAFMRKMQEQFQIASDESEEPVASDADTAVAPDRTEHEKEEREEKERERQEEEQEAIDYIFEDENQPEGGRFERIKSNQSWPAVLGRKRGYEGNPFDLDRVNTRESFRSERSSSTGSRKPSMVSSKSSKRHH